MRDEESYSKRYTIKSVTAFYTAPHVYQDLYQPWGGEFRGHEPGTFGPLCEIFPLNTSILWGTSPVATACGFQSSGVRSIPALYTMFERRAASAAARYAKDHTAECKPSCDGKLCRPCRGSKL